MTKQRPTRNDAAAAHDASSAITHPSREGAPAARGLSGRWDLPTTIHEAAERFQAARDAWIAAMRQAASGRPSDLASLAIAQDEYEAATAELERWRSGERVPIAVDSDPEHRALDVVVSQELAWRHTHETKPTTRPGLLARIARRLSGR